MSDVTFNSNVAGLTERKIDLGGGVHADEVAVTSPRIIETLVIPSGESVSNVLNLDTLNASLLGFIMPAAWTAAALTIEVSHDATTWIEVTRDDLGNQCNVIAAPVASEGYAANALGLLLYSNIRFRSGTTASPVNQGAERSITVISRRMA